LILIYFLAGAVTIDNISTKRKKVSIGIALRFPNESLCCV
jgi:hypothetical protein